MANHSKKSSSRSVRSRHVSMSIPHPP